MTLSSLAEILPTLWLALALPATLVAAGVAAVAFRGRAYLDLGRGFRELASPPESPGGVAPGLAAALASAATVGAAGLAGAGTAVALGGAGALAWVWILALVLAPLRHAEAMLARTPAPGGRGAPGGLAARLRTDRHPAVRAVGVALAVGLAVAGVVVVGGLHGVAAADAVRHLAPEAGPAALGALAVGTLVVMALPWARGGVVVGGGFVVVGLATFVGLALVTVGSEPSRAFGALGRAFGEVAAGAGSVDAFVGATAGEVATGALLGLGLPLATGTGVTGSAHAAASAAMTRRQAALAGAVPLVAALVTTLLGMGIVATGAFYRPLPDQRPLRELSAWTTPFESPGERAEGEGRYTGYMRVVGGAARDLDVDLATDRGMVEGPVRWFLRGVPADLALQVEDGQPVAMLRRAPKTNALGRVPTSELDAVDVEGRMLPRGPGLVLAALGDATGGPGVRLGVIGFLCWTLGAALAWGLAIRHALRGLGPPVVGLVLGCLPAVGLGLVAGGQGEPLRIVGPLVGALVVVLGAVGIVLRAREAARA